MNKNEIIYKSWTFLDKDILDGSMYVAMSLISDQLEANTFRATVACTDSSIIDFERNAPLIYYSEGVQRGIFYVQSITRIGPLDYTIEATSAIGLLIEGQHYGGIYTGQTVSEVLPSICGTVPYVVKTNLRDIALYGWLPVASRRDNLSQVLFAIGAVIKTDLDGVLHIEGLWDGISGTFGKDRMYQGPSVDYAAKVTQVIVTEHQYVEGGESTSLFEGTAQEGDIITFDGPMHNLQATGITILESGANFAKISGGSGTLTGTAYIHNTRQVMEDVLQANEPNVKTVTEATLVSLVNSRSVAQRLANYYKSFQTITADASYQGEVPGNLLSTWHPYDQEAISACLESADITLSNRLKASEELLVGFTPIVTGQSVVYDQHVILTGSGTWTPPAGTVSVHAVLIGGGGPGADGENGESTISPMPWDTDRKRVYTSSKGSTSGSVSAHASAAAMEAGNGGAGGSKGVQGSVYEIDIDLSDMAELPAFQYQCGAAGTVAGESGGQTTFGSYSSASGGILPSGYTDLITGLTYAKPGQDGVAGGNGGSGSGRGEDVASARGGYAQPGDSDSDSDSHSGSHEDSNDLVLYEWTANLSASRSCSASGGGGAGGGTSENPGGNGSDAAFGGNSSGISFGTRSATTYYFWVKPGSGGDGADGLDATSYGSAGDGGHGGGGAGSIGNISVSASVSYSVNVSYVSNDSLTFEASCSFGGTLYGAGGNGGFGGKGKEGCIILYFGVRSTIQTGPIVTSQNKYFLDKYGRKVVV